MFIEHTFLLSSFGCEAAIIRGEQDDIHLLTTGMTPYICRATFHHGTGGQRQTCSDRKTEAGTVACMISDVFMKANHPIS